jgi:hypothetical protein
MKMRIKSIPIAQAAPGMKAARSVRNPSGQVLIQEGVELTEALLHNMARRHISRISVHVEDARSEEELAQERARTEARLDALFRNADKNSTLDFLRRTILKYRLGKLA